MYMYNIWVSTYLRTHVVCIYVSVYICSCVCVHACTCVCACMCVCVCVCVREVIIYIYIYTYIYHNMWCPKVQGFDHEKKKFWYSILHTLSKIDIVFCFLFSCCLTKVTASKSSGKFCTIFGLLVLLYCYIALMFSEAHAHAHIYKDAHRGKYVQRKTYSLVPFKNDLFKT